MKNNSKLTHLSSYSNGKFRESYDHKGFCPRCGDVLPIGYPGAISRQDNKTELCSDCGVREAFEDFRVSNE